MSLVERLLSRTTAVGECLIWTGCLNTDGYARVSHKGNSNGKVHRIIYQELHPEEDVSGKVIRHTCDTPSCINPQHLLSGTPTDNAVDKCVRGRDVLAKLTEEQALQIRALYSTGSYTQKELGNLFNINHRTVHYVIKHKTYKWAKAKED